MSSKALRLLKHHAWRFKQLIALNIDKIHAAVSACCKSEIKALQKHAEDTVYALLSQLSRYVVETRYHASANFLRKLVEGYRDDLTRTPPPPPYELLLATGGLSAIAPSMMLIHSSVDESERFVLGALVALIKSSALIEATSEAIRIEKYERGDSLVFRKSQFVLAASCLLNSVTTPNSCTLCYCHEHKLGLGPISDLL